MKNNELVLGPLSKAACMHIRQARVFAEPALQRCTQLVENVHICYCLVTVQLRNRGTIDKRNTLLGVLDRFTYPSQIRYQYRSALSGAGCSNIALISVNMEIGRG